MYRRLVFMVVFLFTELATAFAQDPEFTQFYANPLYLNPAFAGTARCDRFVLNYRNQWPNIPGTYVTESISWDRHVDALRGGVGVLITQDKAGEGALTTTNASGMYSYQLNISRSFSIKAGFQATYMQKKVDWDKLTFGDMIDKKSGFVLTTNEQRGPGSKSNIDFSSGIMGFSKKYFVGFAMHHLSQPDESLLNKNISKLPMKFTGHVGAIIPLDGKGGDSYISPNILYQKQQDFQQLNLGLYVNKGPVVGGLWYRNKDSFIALIGFQQGLMKFGYSYDVTISKLSNKTAGAHEISFALQLKCKPKTKKFRTISCPSF